MADKEISELTAGSTADGTELLHIDQGGNSRKLTSLDVGKTAYLKGTAIDDTDVDGSNILTLPTNGTIFAFTGTQSVDAIAAADVNRVMLRHGSERTFTHHATDLICPGSSNLIVYAGDVTEWVQYTSGDWACANVQRSASVSAQPDVIYSGALASAAQHDFTDLSDYRFIRAVGSLYPSVDASPIMRFSTNNGTSYLDSGYNLLVIHNTDGTPAPAGASIAATSSYLYYGTGDATDGTHFQFTISNFNQAANAYVMTELTQIDSSGNDRQVRMSTRHTGTTARDALVLITAGANTAGFIHLEGIRG